MKRALLVFAAVIAVSLAANASSQGLFDIDEARIHAEMSELTELESYLAENDVSFSMLAEEKSFMVSNLSNNSMHAMLGLASPPLGISSFLWGFCLGLPGLAIVYFVAEDPAETRKALWGCITSSLLYTAFYVVWYAAWSTTYVL